MLLRFCVVVRIRIEGEKDRFDSEEDRERLCYRFERNKGRAYEVLKPYNSHEGIGKATIKVQHFLHMHHVTPSHCQMLKFLSVSV
ncbi:hypothetical protein P8452_17271 [Trifolium repens]|nr:hypothetical protein P8452_17271 [Trifolium repens]